jgi:tetratricopeptide (TPR) repeat protein
LELPPDFREALIEANSMLVQGRVLDAERVLRRLAEAGPYRHLPLESLADLYLQQRRLEECLSALVELTRIDPANANYSAKLTNLLDSIGQTDAAIKELSRLLEHRPDDATAHFNVALLHRKQHRFNDALSSYDAALRLGIDEPEEVYSNMGNVYSEMLDAGMARQMYERALKIAPEYVPAMFNLAGHFEETGDKQRAIELYERILTIEPAHWKSLARLAYPRKATAQDQGLIDRINACIKELDNDVTAKEVLYFALGKLYDDMESYDKAAEAFLTANELGRHRVSPYASDKTERAFDRLIELFDSSWSEPRRTDSDLAPTFICGMYRSGSTLLERMLAGHPAIAAGGELSTLPWLTGRHLSQFPEGAAEATAEQLTRIAEEYGAATRELAPGAKTVTDKRPDNFLRVGLIMAAFPAAKIIHTRRDIRDNSLSVYFQQFSRAASYANDLKSIFHYYQQQDRLIAHWRECYPGAVCSVDYEELVEAPEPVLRRVLDFLGLEWDAGVLDFQANRGMVRTYSIWQVREGLHSRSRHRWRNYESLLGDLAARPVTDKSRP